MQAVAMDFWQWDGVLAYLLSRGGLEQPQPGSGGILGDQVQCTAQFGLGSTNVVGSGPVSCLGGYGGGGDGCDGDGLVRDGFEVSLGGLVSEAGRRADAGDSL